MNTVIVYESVLELKTSKNVVNYVIVIRRHALIAALAMINALGDVHVVSINVLLIVIMYPMKNMLVNVVKLVLKRAIFMWVFAWVDQQQKMNVINKEI